MRLSEILNDKNIKRMAARTMIVDGILNGEYSADEIFSVSKTVKENKVSVILEAIEEISNKNSLIWMRITLGTPKSIFLFLTIPVNGRLQE